MKIFKDSRSGRYRVRFHTESGVRTISTGASSLTEARKLVEEAKIEELERTAKAVRLTGNVVSQILCGRTVTVELAIGQWVQWMEEAGLSPRTRENNRAYVVAWAAAARVSKRQPSAVGPQEINAWVNAQGEIKAGTRRVRLSAMRSFFGYCVDAGLSLSNPAKLVRVQMDLLTHRQKETASRKIFTDAELAALIDATQPDGTHASAFWHGAIQIGRWTGLRLGDICQLEWGSFAETGQMRVWTDKRDRRVSLPVGPELVVAVSAIPSTHPVYCFPVQRDLIRDPSKRSNLSKQFSRLCARLGMAGRSFHELRHTYATASAENMIPMPQIARDLGHASPETTRGYVHSKG